MNKSKRESINKMEVGQATEIITMVMEHCCTVNPTDAWWVFTSCITAPDRYVRLLPPPLLLLPLGWYFKTAAEFSFTQAAEQLRGCSAP